MHELPPSGPTCRRTPPTCHPSTAEVRPSVEPALEREAGHSHHLGLDLVEAINGKIGSLGDPVNLTPSRIFERTKKKTAAFK